MRCYHKMLLSRKCTCTNIRTHRNQHVPPKKFRTDRVHVWKCTAILHGWKSLVPDDDVHFRLCFSKNLRVYCHGKEERG